MHSTRKNLLLAVKQPGFVLFSLSKLLNSDSELSRALFFVHLKEISFIWIQSCSKTSHLTGELLLEAEWMPLAWGGVIKIEHGKSLFSFICAELKCLHQERKSFAENNVFWDHFFQICLCLLFVVILSIPNPYFSHGGNVPSRLE